MEFLGITSYTADAYYLDVTIYITKTLLLKYVQIEPMFYIQDSEEKTSV